MGIHPKDYGKFKLTYFRSKSPEKQLLQFVYDPFVNKERLEDRVHQGNSNSMVILSQRASMSKGKLKRLVVLLHDIQKTKGVAVSRVRSIEISITADIREI